MYLTIKAWLVAHPAVKAAFFMAALPILGAYFNWATWKRTPEAWAAYKIAHPYLTILIKVTRAVLPHLKTIPALRPFLPASMPPSAMTTPPPPVVVPEAPAVPTKAPEAASEISTTKK